MRNLFDKNSRGVLYRLSISFICMLIVPLLAWSILYMQTENIISKKAINYNNAVIKSSVKNMNDITNWISYNNAQLTMNRNLGNIKNYTSKPSAEEHYEMGQLSNELWSKIISNDKIYEIYIYFPKFDYCVYSGGNMSSRDFYGIQYGGSEEEYEAWLSDLNQNKYFRQKNENMLESVSNKSISCVSFIQPLQKMLETYAICVTSVKEKEFLQAFSEGTEETAILAVKDNRNNIIIHGGDKELPSSISEVETSGKMKIDGDKYYVFRTKISIPSWEVISAIPMKSIFSDLSSLRIWSALLLAVYIVICVCVLRYLLKYNYAPVKNMLNKIASATGTAFNEKANEYTFIEQAFYRVNSQKQALGDLLENNENIIKQSFFNSLLKGNAKLEEWNKNLAEFGITLVGDKYLTILCRIENPNKIFEDDDSLNARERLRWGNFIVDSILSEILSESLCVMSTAINDMTAYIVNTDDETKIYDSVKHCILEAQRAVADYFGFSFTATISEPHNTYSGICEAYEEAFQTMEYRILYNDGAIIRYSEIQTPEKGSYYYPFEKEKILINCIKNGDYSAAKRVIDEIYDLNFKQNNLSAALARCLMFDMTSTIIKTIDELTVDFSENMISKDMEKLLNSPNVYDMQETILEILKKVCDYVQSKSDVYFKNKVIDFIEKNYANSQLTVTMIADYMGLNPTYVSNVFSEKSGIRLLDYIMRYRINKAKELFAKKDGRSVAEVAGEVGYDNLHTFVRIFKKYEGVTPTQYVKTINCI